MKSRLDVNIVPAGPGDAAALARVHVRAWRETYPGLLQQTYLDAMSVPINTRRWAWRLSRTDEITLAAEAAEGLVGYCSGNGPFGQGDAEVTTLYVVRSAQGEGLGYRLLTGTARALAARGATSLVIWVLRDNRRARRFYEGLGGAPAGERLERVGGGAASVAYRWTDLGGLTG